MTRPLPFRDIADIIRQGDQEEIQALRAEVARLRAQLKQIHEIPRIVKKFTQPYDLYTHGYAEGWNAFKDKIRETLMSRPQCSRPATRG